VNHSEIGITSLIPKLMSVILDRVTKSETMVVYVCSFYEVNGLWRILMGNSMEGGTGF
jgi:hypothetical protein